MKTERNTRPRIISSAKMAFAKWGYELASMSRIAKLANLDKSSLYYFFKNKEDLFAAVSLDTWQQLSRSVSKNLTKKSRVSPKKILSGACQDFIKIFLNAGMSSTRMELPNKNHFQFQLTTQIINKTQNEALRFLKLQKVEHPELAQSIIANSIHAYVLHSSAGKTQPPVKQYCDYLSSLIIL